MAPRLCTLLLALVALPAAALDFRSIAEPALLYDAPSAQAARRFIIARGTPLELVLANGAWSKVRDAQGDMAWIESRALSTQRTVMVRADRAQIRSQADDKSPLVFEAGRDVVLDLVDATSTVPAGWARVRHRDGQQGYVRIPQIWGL
ncbi:MAG: hypothetical protein JSR19_08430 [Proteobacteria bacterium]|nr:hypothetical protein [Pseudomonadota bacterium]HQR04214.1 SH3 domain-containing protein [Rhodocyclaceae bacterium]